MRATLFAAGLWIASGARPAAAQNCSSEYLIDHTSTTGARWEMCFEHRTMDGIVLHDIHFTSPDGSRNKVLGEASVSQIHVPYDDNGARYHDVSDYGIGGSRLNDLQPVDCPGGTRRLHNGKHVLCTTMIDRGFHSWGGEQRGNGELLEVLSVSHVGAYNYMPVWRFHDDGTIEVAMGATGRLQRVSTSVDREPHGWYISTDTIGLSHLHNYYWRLDFDLGSSATDDVVEEIDFVPNGSRETRSRQITAFTNEVERSIDEDRNRRWRVVDTATNADGHPISWEIEPLLMGHRDIGPSYEEWTFNDLWVTRHRSCERWASHNPTSGGCASQIDEFAGSPSDPSVPESVVGEDIVVWFGLSFHHIPRDEDEPRMPAHWNSFRIVPRDVDAINPLAASPTNAAPTVEALSGRSNAEGESPSVQAQGSDPDGDSLIWSASGLPGGLTIDDSSGLISGTLDYSSAGSWSVTVTASDGSLSDSTTFSWTVSNTNRAPQIASVAAQSHAEGATVSLELQGSDPDGETLVWSASGLPLGLSISSATGRVSGVLGFASAGSYEVSASASDGAASDTATFDWNVTETNRAPEVQNPGPRSDSEGQSVSVQISGSDPDGNSLSWSAVGLPGDLAIDPSSGLISGTLSFASAGSHSVSVTASDGALSDVVSFSWGVSDTNRPPEITYEGNQQSAEGDPVSQQMEGSDPDGDSLSWSATGLPDGVTIAPTTGLISGTVSYESEGAHSVTLTASDGSLSDSVSFSWLVGNTNRSPVASAVGNQESAEGASVSLPMQGSDPDGDSLTWSASGLPPALSIAPATGLISGTLSYDSAGAYSVVVQASDGFLSYGVSFGWTVANVNRPPVVDPHVSQRALEGVAFELQITAADPDDDSLTFSATGLPPGLTIDAATGMIHGEASLASEGEYTVTVMAHDGDLEATATFVIRVVAPVFVDRFETGDLTSWSSVWPTPEE